MKKTNATCKSISSRLSNLLKKFAYQYHQQTRKVVIPSNKNLAITLCLILLVLTGLPPQETYADDGSIDSDKPIRLYAYERSGPIGKVESFTGVRVNGLLIRDEQLIWGGELLQAPAQGSVRLSLDSVGQVTLHCGTIAKFSVKPKRFDAEASAAVLIASLVRGNVVVKLRDNAEAYVEAGGFAHTSSRGANFTIGIGENGVLADATVGAIRPEMRLPQQRFYIRPNANSAKLSVHLRSSRQLQFRVTDERDKPVPDMSVVLTLTGSNATFASGATTVTVTTNSLGIATTTVSGTSIGSASVTATIAGTTISTTVGVSVAAAGILTGATVAGITAAVAAGATTAVVVKTKEKEELKEARPPKITP